MSCYHLFKDLTFSKYDTYIHTAVLQKKKKHKKTLERLCIKLVSMFLCCSAIEKASALYQACVQIVWHSSNFERSWIL